MIKDLTTLKEPDLYSLSMFTLYKLVDIPEYSSISELSYILDKNNLLKLCEYFGGLTIKIPTLDELYSIMNLLLLYQYINIDKIPYEKAIKLIGFKFEDNYKIKSAYSHLCTILNNYDIKTRDKYK